MSHRDEQYEKVDTRQEFFTVLENDLKFQVNLTDYLDTGLFLDHRITREMVRSEAKDKRFLNLFCYTATASVHAQLFAPRLHCTSPTRFSLLIPGQ